MVPNILASSTWPLRADERSTPFRKANTPGIPEPVLAGTSTTATVAKAAKPAVISMATARTSPNCELQVSRPANKFNSIFCRQLPSI
eukprot:Skav223324  [mRNA]  locus=scaffold200:88789:90854:- [translate_table: standard]